MIRYADDEAVVASSHKGLQELMTRLNVDMNEYDMKVNVKETKLMHITQYALLEANAKVNGKNRKFAPPYVWSVCVCVCGRYGSVEE